MCDPFNRGNSLDQKKGHVTKSQGHTKDYGEWGDVRSGDPLTNCSLRKPKKP